MKTKKIKLDLHDLRENQNDILDFLQRKEMETLYGGSYSEMVYGQAIYERVPYPKVPYCKCPYSQMYAQAVPPEIM